MPTYENLDYGSPDGSLWGRTSTDLIGCHGATPTTMRAGAAQATSLVATASSADVTTELKAAVIEIMNTLTAKGIWKGSA